MALGPKPEPPRVPRRFITCIFWAFGVALITVTLAINLSVLHGDLGLSIEGDVTAKLSWSLTNHLAVGEESHDFSAEPLLDLLRYANVSLSESEMDDFPKWKEVVSRFGNGPRILGLETCSAYREAVPFKNKRVIAPAGAFNSGTNLLFDLLAKNCRVSKYNPETLSKTGVDWQVNWGKHQSPRFRFVNVLKHWKNNSAILPIVVVRDPWTWFQSMCRQSYAAIWYHVPGPEGHCPNFVPSDVERQWFSKSRGEVAQHFRDRVKVRNVMLKANFTLDMETVPVNVRYKNEVARHQSLAHFWSEWYKEYYEAPFPRLMIRLEDIVFHPYETLKSVCDCVHGKFVPQDNFTLQGGSIKNSEDRAHSRTQLTTLKTAFFLHLRSNRTQGMTLEDNEFARSVLDNSPVRQYFGYQPPGPGQ